MKHTEPTVPAPEEAFGTARFAVAQYFKYLSTVMYAVAPVYVPDMDKIAPGPIGVDTEWRCYFGDQFVGMPVPTQVALLYHEVAGHLLRNHAGRAESLGVEVGDRMRWNVAADCAINDETPTGSGGQAFPFPQFSVFPSRFKLPDGELEEWYYTHLPVVKMGMVMGCGSGSGGDKQPYEQEGKNTTAPSRLTQELIRQVTAEAIRDAEAQKAGTVPGDLVRWAGDYLSPKGDWRRELRAAVVREIDFVLGRDDYSYQKISRRSPPGMILPGMTEVIPAGGIVWDTSGSMGADEQAQARAEVGEILRDVLPNGAPVFVTDAVVHAARVVWDVSQVQLIGGGGTNMGCGIQAAESYRPKLDFCVVVTDGETPWPESAGVPVVVALIRDTATLCPSWARVVRCF